MCINYKADENLNDKSHNSLVKKSMQPMLQNESEKATEIKQNNVLGLRVMNLGGKKKTILELK